MFTFVLKYIHDYIVFKKQFTEQTISHKPNQKFGNGTNDYDDGTTVPTYKDECTLWSLVTVAE